MDKLKSPFWLIMSSVLPYLLLILFFYETYQIIESLLSIEQKQYWFNYGVYFAIVAFIILSYSVGLIITGKSVGLRVSWGILLLSILNLTLYFAFIDEVLPFDIPSWMFTATDLSIYPYTFIIPSTLYALILLVLHYTPAPSSNNPYLSLAPILMVPAVVAGAIFVLSSIGTTSTDLWVLKYLPLYILVFFTCALVYFVIRFLYILSAKSKKRDALALILKVLFTVAFPAAGLALNNGFTGFDGGLFGDFSHPLYYVLAVLNGIAVCLPNPTNTGLRWVLFISRSILFSFILFFVAVFLPFLPLSIFAILAVGFGFLMLTPLVVFVLQVTILRQDIQYLSLNVPRLLVQAVFVLCLLVMPASLTVHYTLDRHQLDEVFGFLYDRSFEDEAEPQFNTKRLTRLLQHIDETKSISASHTPFLDSYYSWIVLDNLMLSDKKIDDISSVLIGGKFEEPKHWRNWWSFPSRNATLDSIEVESTYNGEFWTSYAHLSVSTGRNQFTEFRTYIQVPPDCHVSNYYLDIERRREYGILAEKRTANWVYNNIVKTRLDPGILNEIADNRFMLKVFPVTSAEPRTTGIEFIHKEPISVTIGDRTVMLGTPQNRSDPTSAYEVVNGEALFVSEQAKRGLDLTTRTPEYHLIVDRSKTSSWEESSLVRVINSLSESLDANGSVRYWAGNYNFTELDKQTWVKQALSVENQGGFYPEFLMKRELKNNWSTNRGSCPIFIMLVSDSTEVCVLEGFSNFMFTTPDMPDFFTIDPSGKVQQVDLESAQNVTDLESASILPNPVYRLNWDNAIWYLDTAKQAEILYDSIKTEPSNKWETALALESQTRQLALNPQLENEWLSVVKTSIASGILSPFTSYISLENEAQKKALLHKQQEVLNSNENFDLEEAEPMSEPSIMWYLILAMLLWFWSSRKKRIVAD